MTITLPSNAVAAATNVLGHPRLMVNADRTASFKRIRSEIDKLVVGNPDGTATCRNGDIELDRADGEYLAHLAKNIESWPGATLMVGGDEALLAALDKALTPPADVATGNL